MINSEKLKAVLKDYKKDFISDIWEEEKFKWIAVKHFQDNWDINEPDFLNIFMKSTEKTENLLVSQFYYPKDMIKEFCEADPEAVRAMFINLYDESKDLAERIVKFKSDSDAIKQKYDNGSWKNHFQNPNSISTYLWLRYPDKYYIYKYSEYKDAAKELESDFSPKRNSSEMNVIKGYKFYDEICNQLSEDKELVDLLKSVLTDECYPDNKLKTLTIDVGFYIRNIYNKKSDNNSKWYPADYNPNISTDQWLELLNDKTIFTKKGLVIMKRMKDIGGQATCTDLSKKYGETRAFYSGGSYSIAKHIAEKIKCPVRIGADNKPRWYPILYEGRFTDKNEDGVYKWKLRDELSEALDKFDLSEVELYPVKKAENNSNNYWWLSANPKIWSFSAINIGETQNYTLYNDNGNKRRIFQNFLDAKAGDIIIGYESNPVKQVVALAKVTEDTDDKNLYFEKIEGFSTPIDYKTLKSYSELENMEFFKNPNGSLFKLKKDEYDFIIDMIREENPIIQKEISEEYSKEKFLEEVYMSEESYDTLVSLLRNKKNIILQGAPGVGKTFSAKRLAYSIMGNKDDSHIEFIQFHQNYSYEDFVMGYRPQEDGFVLQNGIFYNFCQTASNNPDEPFFFIIDEINRGNLSKIFGELLMLIEKDYRETNVTLAYSGRQFKVPKNLYIIGMMNTADRSLAMIDYALRRRFSFYDMGPGFISDGFEKYQSELNNETFDSLISEIRNLNKTISEDDSLGKGFCIGHSYFCSQTECTDEWMMQVVEHDIIPMLNEYWFDDQEKIQHWENTLRGLFSD